MTDSALHIAVHAGHDANVTVVNDHGEILFAAGEERFNRIKMFAGFPACALAYAVQWFGGKYRVLASPRMPAARKMQREAAFFLNSFRKGLAAPRFSIWLKQGMVKLFRGRALEQGGGQSLHAEKIHNVEHHVAHAASAYYPSGFEHCRIMTLDGEGDGYSCCLFDAAPGRLTRVRSYYHNELTIGRDYEKVTAMLGFHPLRHPGKVTGLAAYGNRNAACMDRLEDYLRDSWRATRHRMLASGSAYQVISETGRKELIADRNTLFKEFSREDLAFAIQSITERKVLDIITRWIPDPQNHNIALAGGVFANVALNKRIWDLGFKGIFIQPGMTDAGLSLGAALHSLEKNQTARPVHHVYYGPGYSPDDIRAVLRRENLSFEEPADMAETAADLLAEGKVVARFDGPMEFGPRALGNRSILYHAGDPSVNDWLNRQLQRSEFMPFAPVTLSRCAADCYLNCGGAEHTAKFMTITFACTETMKKQAPATVHIDGTARPQLIDLDTNEGYASILEAYYRKTGIPSIVNTSFNMHEEPIVMTPEDALRAFIASRLDAMVMGPFLIFRRG